MNLHQGAMDDIWNNSQFDEHYELIQSGGYENLFQTAGATGPEIYNSVTLAKLRVPTGPTGPATTPGVTGPVAPSNFNAWPYVIGAIAVLAIFALIYWVMSKAKSDPTYFGF